METPCIDICQINQASRLCEGCWRSIAEITAWAKMSPAERRKIMDELPARAVAAKNARRAISPATDADRPAPEREA